jgi:2-oxoglutarate dehydrogenase complex dehydrogenase (E1) component-like enzyme
MKGQGPEHSSARLERYLQLCAEDNMQVANCTTPANYFHILRRQMHRDFRKPLVIMTPKSLLRHKLAVSQLADFTGDSHFKRILSDPTPRRRGREAPRPVLGQGRLRADGSARQGGRPRHRDRPDRAALSLPVRAAGRAPQAHDQPRGGGLGAGRAEEQAGYWFFVEP